MNNKIKTAAGAVCAALCFLTVFFLTGAQVHAASAQLTHCHTGSRQNGGGCYGEKKTGIKVCHSYNVSCFYNGQSYTYVCGQCNSRWDYPYQLNGACCSSQVTETYYETNCGKSGAAAVSFSCEKSTEAWAKELALTASYSVQEEGISISGYLWNGSPGGSSYRVTENGTYTLGLTGSGNADFSPVISITVDHIDNTAPVVESFGAESDGWSQSVQLCVNASDAGSGLANEAYSYDNGASWHAERTYMATENGSYRVQVRDAVGNVSTAETVVSRIDRTPPAVSVSTSPSVDNWYDGSLTVTVHAQDAESGLSDAPYSFDGGASYLVGNLATLSGSGTFEIAVADHAGNVTRLSFHAEKKQRPQPTQTPGSGSVAGGGNAANAGAGGSVAGGGNATNAGAGGSGAGGGNASNAGAGGSGAENAETDSAGDAGGGNPGTGGAGNADASGEGGTESQETAGAGGNTGSGKGAGVGSIGGGADRTRQNAQGDQQAEGGGSGTDAAESGKNSGLNGAAIGKSGGDGRGGLREFWNDTLQEAETLPQHYPDGLPRVESMTGDGQGGVGSQDGTGGRDGEIDQEESATDSGSGESVREDGGRVEETIIQNELLASANEQEAAILNRTGNAGAGAQYGGVWMMALCAALLAAAVLFGWALLFGVRVDTKDERGHYRFAGMTRVTTEERERLHVVPLTKQIIRNSHTNELRIRLGLLCRKRHGGETLLLRYRSIRREFKADGTAEMHIRA